MTSVAQIYVQNADEIQDGGLMNEADDVRQPKLSLDTDSLSSQPSQLSTPNTPNEPLSPHAPSDLVSYDEQPSRPESFVTWRSQLSPTDGQPETFPTPWAAAGVERSVPPLNLSLSRKSQRRAVTTASTIPEEDEDVLYQTRSPLPVHVPEPDIEFDGTDPYKCCDLIRDVWTYAWKMGKHTDKRWIAEFAATRLTRGVIAWYSRLSVEVKYDWDKLHHELIEAWGPRSPDSANPSLFISDQWGGLTRSSSQSTTYTSPPSTATSSLMPITPNSTGLLSPQIIPHGSFETNGNGGRVSPDPLHIGLPPSPLPAFKCLHPPGPLNSSTQWQYGRLRVADYTDRLHYVALDLNTLGGCETTTKRHEALCVRVRLGTCRVLYLDNCPPPYDTLGVTWDMSKRQTPHLNRGSTDRANLVFLDKENSSSARVFRGRSKDAVWTIKQDNTVRVSWPDENNNDHELHVVVKGESMWSWPGRISLVADVDAFMTRHHGYVRSTLIFEPMT
ncbi:hypothetical protein FRC04_004688 [Tulasnella sp. 424]|nr:hypothetical protein FRC04_004688 [Tulasnella sp. 424]KAG8965026.1 hypothetical protein FRC05_003501 [Tulasnella sp. 425]